MHDRPILGVGMFAVAAFFLPLIGFGIRKWVLTIPWQEIRWLLFPIIALGMVWIVQKRREWQFCMGEVSLLQKAKLRLAKGEISLDEYREIRQELQRDL